MSDGGIQYYQQLGQQEQENESDGGNVEDLCVEISLRPYTGRLYVTNSAEKYEIAHVNIFKNPDMLNCSQGGRLSGGEGNDGKWTYLIFAKDTAVLVHEFSHVILHVFERCGIDPREACGEPFCYMIQQMLTDYDNRSENERA